MASNMAKAGIATGVAGLVIGGWIGSTVQGGGPSPECFSPYSATETVIGPSLITIEQGGKTLIGGRTVQFVVALKNGAEQPLQPANVNKDGEVYLSTGELALRVSVADSANASDCSQTPALSSGTLPNTVPLNSTPDLATLAGQNTPNG
jgi:hypothetical protein